MHMKKNIYLLLSMALALTSCHNSDWDFPDYDYTSVYFAQQTPVRTITLGDDVYDTSLDNEYKCKIYATMGGVYENNTNRIIGIKIDDSLCDHLTYSDGSLVKALPSNYYSLASSQIVIPTGKVMGGVEVQFTDAFFNDPKSITTTYVIPLVMTDVQKADSILKGKVKEGVISPSRVNRSDWNVVPKDYILYAVKYKNKWHGNWLSRGIDVIDDNGTITTVERKAQYIEKDEVRVITTTAFKQVRYPVSTVVKVHGSDGKITTKTLVCDLILTFSDDDKCVITTDTENCTATGTGVWTNEGAKKAWGDKDRDELKLKYEINFKYTQADGQHQIYKKYTCDDTLVARDRGSKLETFSFVYN